MKPTISAFLAWLVPGAGHFYLGRRGRAAIYFAVVVASFALGLLLDGRIYLPERGAPLTLFGALAQAGTGLPWILHRLLGGSTGDVHSVTWEHGTTFLITAGLMNLLLSLDAHDIARGRKP